MAIRRYKAAGGVVIQRGMIEGLDKELDEEKAYVLLLDRPDRDEVRLPKGHIDPGEDAQEAALRETEEEAGFADLSILADLGSQTVEFDYKGRHYIRGERYFLMTLRSSRCSVRPTQDEEQFRPLWIELENAADRLTFDAEQTVVRAAVERYRKLFYSKPG